MKEIIRLIAKYYITAAMVTAFIVFESQGIPYSDLFVSLLTACVGTTGIMVYGDVRKS